MSQISISIDIDLDNEAVTALGAGLGALLAALREYLPGAMPAPTAPALPDVTSPAKPAKPKGKRGRPRTAADAPGIPPAEIGSHSNGVADHSDPNDRATRGRVPFYELDPLVRMEIKRLSMDGRIPGHKLFNEARHERLPTLGAIIRRYNCTNLIDFAAEMGMEPPLSALNGNVVMPAFASAREEE